MDEMGRQKPSMGVTPPMLRATLMSWEVEAELWEAGYTVIAGIDEAGRGALAGPVVAAAVVLPPQTLVRGVDDSKRLSPAERERLFHQIIQVAAGIGVGTIDARTIEAVNIRQATLLAMEAAMRALPHAAEFLLVDGCDLVPSALPQRAFVRGDQTVGSIAAASIVAKVMRDRFMVRLDGRFPGYGFAQHKGYGTTAHRRAIQQLGSCAIHRKTFRGVMPPAGSHA
jgi:ribonuclease HII